MRTERLELLFVALFLVAAVVCLVGVWPQLSHDLCVNRWFDDYSHPKVYDRYGNPLGIMVGGQVLSIERATLRAHYDCSR